MKTRRDPSADLAATGPAARATTPGKGSQIEASYGGALARPAEGGAPLPGGVRGELESALGADLSTVRVHTGGPSAASADDLDAKAYAVGQDIHFGAGAYDPGSLEGRHLLAHEVAHTVQQQGTAPGVQRYTEVSSREDGAERQANRFAHAFAVGAPTAGLVTAGLQPTATVHRFERDEHADIPTKDLKELYAFLATPEGVAWAKQHGYDAVALRARMKDDPVIKGEKLHGGKDSDGKGKRTEYSYGEVTALMGDLYGKWDELYKAPTSEKEGLMHANSTADYQKFSHGKYLDLAKNNADHFGGKNQEAWLKHHELAIETAAGAAQDPSKLEEALFIDAAGAHFLTDAFSSGHQFEKGVVLSQILLDLRKQPLQSTNPQMQTYVGALGDDNTALLILKLIHDRMNEEGYPIENGLGMKWRTFGDGNLSRSPETQRIAALAVFESRQQVISAQRDAAAAMANVKSVQKFFPTVESMHNAELTAISYIPEARKHVEELIYKERGSAPGEIKDRVKIPLLGTALGKIAEANLDAVGDPARAQQLELDRQLKDARGDHEPTVEPSFTVARW